MIAILCVPCPSCGTRQPRQRWRDVEFDGESLHVYGSYSLGALMRLEAAHPYLFLPTVPYCLAWDEGWASRRSC
jgi:hypothetical protein